MKKVKVQHPVVVIERDWKEYLGECLLIVFSVLLALILTEVINNFNERKKTAEVLHQLKEELIDNKRLEAEQYQYHLLVLKNIDTALNNPAIASKFITNGKINLNIIAPEGVIRHDLNDVAWQVAKQNDILSKIDIETYSIITDCYNNQLRITNSEEKIGQLLLSWESRKPENLKATLILMRDNYHAWDVDRAPNLLNRYQEAINKLNGY